MLVEAATPLLLLSEVAAAQLAVQLPVRNPHQVDNCLFMR